MSYTQQFDGEWFAPRRRGWRMRCCDCRLVHVVDIRMRGGQVQMRARRDKRATAASRRKTAP